jgi:hypothetical protein
MNPYWRMKLCRVDGVIGIAIRRSVRDVAPTARPRRRRSVDGRKDRRPTMLRVSLISGLVAISCATGPVPAVAARWSLHLLPRPAGSGRRNLSARLDGVSCPTPTWCVAVGMAVARSGAELPLIEQWNGSRWSRQPSPRLAGAALDAVSCTSDRSCVSIGAIGIHGLVERLHHGVWTRGLLPRSLTSVSCSAASTCTAVGGTRAFRWDGKRWRSQQTARPGRNAVGGVALQAVSCPSAGSCLAVGNNGCESLAERWNGSRWAVLRTPDAGYCTKRGTGAPAFTGVSCASASACIAVGTIQPLNESQIDRPLTERWNGLRWSMQRTGEVTSALSCPAVGSCTAVGVQPPLVNAERWNGIRWTAQPLPVPRTPELEWSLDAVSCASRTRCIAVGGLTDTSPEEWPLVAEYRGSAR